MEENNKFYLDLLSLQSEMSYREYSISTQGTYKRIVKEFLETTNKEVIDVKKEDVIRYLDSKLMTLSVNTVLVELNALEFFFEEILGLNITENIRKYKRVFKTKDFITIEQFNILVASVSERERLTYLVLKELGLFFKEIVKIKVEDIDYTGSTISGRRVNRDLIRNVLGYAEKHDLENEIFPLDLSTLWYWNKVNTKKYLGRVCSLDDMKHLIDWQLHYSPAGSYLENVQAVFYAMKIATECR